MNIISYDSLDSGALFMRAMEQYHVEEPVAQILSQVSSRGDEALLEFCERFDHVSLSSLEVTKEEIEEAMACVSSELLSAMELAEKNIREYHLQQVRQGFSIEREDGVVMGQKITPIEKVGLYIPGGTAAYPSTVLMLATPAKIAGCKQIVITTPPSRSGKVAAPILAAARLAGVDRIFKVGGAQAIGALAYGTESIPKVDKIVGPGNAYVAEAKRQVFGKVNIDMIAGPSEILVIADNTCDPVCVAADLLSQAEHDKMSSAVLVTDSMELAQKVSDEVERQLCLLPREEIARASIENNGRIIVTKDLLSAIDASNQLAPEHLEICVENPMPYLERITNAGSVFLGKYCPEALGDYLAGPNHTLPTSGTARFSSPLSVDDFVKKTQFSYFTPEALQAVADQVAVFARAEGLEAHARSALSRFSKGECS